MSETKEIGYAIVEEVDSVLTVTLAEGPGEQGFLLHVMRTVPEDESDPDFESGFDPELEDYEIANATHRAVESCLEDWSLSDGVLRLSFTEEGADELQFPRSLALRLRVADETLRDLDAALTRAFAPVGTV